MNVKNILTIFKREFYSYIHSASSYVFLSVFLFVWFYLFFRSVFLVGESSLRSLFELLPWLLLIVISAVTMGSISKEKETGTLEVALTQPIREIEFILGKWIGASIYVFISLSLTIINAYIFSRYGLFDWGVYWAQMFGAFLLVFSLSAIGVYISSLVRSQLTSLLTTVAIGFLLLIIGTELITANLPLIIAPYLEKLSLYSHYYAISRGVIDTRDVWYFLSLIAVSISLTYLSFIKERFGNRKDKYHTYRVNVFLLIGIVLLTNVLGERIPGRVDLTHYKRYTLSEGTKKILHSLPDVVTITLYASGKLPPQYSPVIRDTKDLLQDMKKESKGSLSLLIKDPSQTSSYASEAQSQGIQEVQFNVIGKEEFQVKSGYMGLVVSYAGKTETIPFIKKTEDLEYQIISRIRKLTVKEKKKISIFTAHNAGTPFTSSSKMYNELSSFYDVSKDEQVASDAAVLIISHVREDLTDQEKEQIAAYPQKGKSLLIADETYDINPQISLTAKRLSTNINDILASYGVSIKDEIVYDLRSNELINVGSGGINFLLPYPYWMKAIASERLSSVITQPINSVTVAWASPLDTDNEKAKNAGYEIIPLLTSSLYAGTSKGDFTISPKDASFSKENLDQKLIAVSLSPKDTKKGKIAVIGDSDIASDTVGSQNDNISFVLSLLSWLSQDETLSTIVSKRSGTGHLLFSSSYEVEMIKYGILSLTILIPLITGVVILKKRSRLKTIPFKL